MSLGLAVAALSLGQGGGRVWARYEAEMQDPVDDPPDAWRKGEFVQGRLRYRSPMDRWGRYSRWGIDANKGDRLFIGLLRRLTRIDVQPVETIVDIDSDEVFDLPWLFAVSVGDWELSAKQAARLRQYFDRGGFLMVDDFHNESEWATFMEGIRQIYPAAEVVELDDSHSAFNTLFNLKDRVRVPGANVVHGSGIERGGTVPHWRGIVDTAAACSWRSASTWTSATAGSSPTIRRIPNASHPKPHGSGRTTSSMR